MSDRTQASKEASVGDLLKVLFTDVLQAHRHDIQRQCITVVIADVLAGVKRFRFCVHHREADGELGNSERSEEPQAAVDSQIRRRILVRREPAEKTR